MTLPNRCITLYCTLSNIYIFICRSIIMSHPFLTEEDKVNLGRFLRNTDSVPREKMVRFTHHAYLWDCQRNYPTAGNFIFFDPPPEIVIILMNKAAEQNEKAGQLAALLSSANATIKQLQVIFRFNSRNRNNFNSGLLLFFFSFRGGIKKQSSWAKWKRGRTGCSP